MIGERRYREPAIFSLREWGQPDRGAGGGSRSLRLIGRGAPMTWSYRGQSALVTGGASGIGRAVSLALAKAGAHVVVADVNFAAAEDVSDLISARGGSAIPMLVDVGDIKSVEQMVAGAINATGSLEIFVHSAGIGIERPFLETSDDEWNRVIDTNLRGTFYCMREVGRVMAPAGYGRIVVVASTAGVAGGSGRAAYGAAKGGVIMLARVLAVELAQSGVTVNALAPGAIETELVARMHSQATRINYRRSIPIDRYGTPEEVANAALYLCSRESSYVTGHVLAVDGGFLAAGVINRATDTSVRRLETAGAHSA